MISDRMPRTTSPLAALAFSLAVGLAIGPGPARADEPEPLPAGAPSEPYDLAAWCYGAMAEYLEVYERVKPDLRDIDRLFGASVKNEAEPYQDDIAAARQELKVLGGAVVAAEKASVRPISARGAESVREGRGIWSPSEARTRRELARAWLSWALPDRCDANARDLTARSNLLGQALKYNAGSALDMPAAAAPPAPAAEPTPPSAPVPAGPRGP